ncbi:replication protein P [Marinomonas mediterranea]|uniref:Uncharacterized protein n=1 Tax=Marinomonas mediterranea (strain ATCC 700492 / JCM 21426 / NBRC 103028 / MMB-1) TaxID=717774 RepID=F2JZ63_MARM1|nr:replication protein P [Marinomonas mediterranea]ADZ92041.1 hypothetical protein Marme_2818 [Marinomonas mediterranea MMB-1]
MNKLAAPSQTSTTQTGNASADQHSADSSQQTEEQQRTRLLVNMLFARFKAIYTHKFASAYSTTEEVKLAKREWAIALKGFKEPLLAYAVERAKEQFAWPPSISEFLKVIHSAYTAYGLVEPRGAYAEAARCRIDPREFKWSHPVVFHAGCEVGWFKLKTEEEHVTWPVFEKAYLSLMDRVIEGESFTIPTVTLIENKATLNVVQIISEIAASLSTSEDEIAPMLYYLHKTPNTLIRKQYREKALKQLLALGYQGNIPD